MAVNTEWKTSFTIEDTDPVELCPAVEGKIAILRDFEYVNADDSTAADISIGYDDDEDPPEMVELHRGHASTGGGGMAQSLQVGRGAQENKAIYIVASAAAEVHGTASGYYIDPE